MRAAIDHFHRQKATIRMRAEVLSHATNRKGDSASIL
jgi:hypothetical protein